ncbi:hypothetical protein HDV05_003858 [Chytridiales sp. JEL 0842]|nr:hypothetical protein HDV05_003858 [Chytridiales sp. JEL 0842]
MNTDHARLRIHPQTQHASRKAVKNTTDVLTSVAPSISQSKELQEAIFALERKSVDMRQLKDDLTKVQQSYEEQKAINDNLEREMTESRAEIAQLRAFKAAASKESETAQTTEAPTVAAPDVAQLKIELEVKDAEIADLKRQMMGIAMDANRKHNEQQNQLQGVEALIESIRKEYDEFIQITKLETESFRAQQQAEYNELKDHFEQHKISQFEEKKRLILEYAGLLYSMQSQFEEYRITAEFMFNTEMAKLEDELSLQATRYEHEIMYVMQAKDKFYADMMVAKDAKIMNLIEGSDLQSLMQKHELDIENLRKEHAREIERVKTDQESEHKSLITLLQRQNSSLESKCEKLQAHLKTLEMRIRELMSTIDSKIKLLNDREEQKIKMENEYEVKLADANAKIATLSQEKEHLRHKVIRLNLNAKGEGENSIENMLKRISRPTALFVNTEFLKMQETADLHGEFEQLSSRYDSLIGENQVLVRRLKEREKFAEFLEREVARRTEEYSSMTQTFEDFLAGRAKQARKERMKRLPKIFGGEKESSALERSQTLRPEASITAKSVRKPTVTRTVIPAKGEKTMEYIPQIHIENKEEGSAQKIELERGYTYLRRFKRLSRAFQTGDFRIIPSGHYETPTDSVPGPWQKTPLYTKLDDASVTVARFYKEQPRELLELASKPILYKPEGGIGGEPRVVEFDTESDVRVYEDKVGVSALPAAVKVVGPIAKKVSEKGHLMVGGISAFPPPNPPQQLSNNL